MGCKSSDKIKPTKPKTKHRKGLWSPEEDQRLRNCILQHGHGCWSTVPINAGLQRNGKSCRLRWINYLRPGLKRGTFTAQEEETILNLHRAYGNKWSQIAQHLPGRTDNEIKNYWHTYLKKKIACSENIGNMSNTQFTESNDSEDITLQTKSITTISSLSPLKKEECSPIDSDQLVRNQVGLPIFFAEWLNLDNNIHNYQENNTQANDRFPPYNSKIDIADYNVDLQSFVQGVTYSYNEGSSNSDQSYSGLESGAFDSQLKFDEDQTEYGIGDLLPANEYTDDLFLTSNVMYM